jgi:membrane peptidoglycan carboxypeptidase
VAEDSRFYEHGGIDFQAIEEAMAYNLKRGKVLLGASTISQQTTKNMFLSLSRNPLRKWHELILTYIMEGMLEKPQILHIYLNVAEFGTGVYGLEAAARAYYGVSAYQLSQEQAIELAATLPSPKKNNPKSRTRSFQKRVVRIASTLRIMDQYVAQQNQRPGPSQEAIKQDLEKKLEELRQDMKVEAAAEVQAELTPEEKPSDTDLANSLGQSTSPESEAVDTSTKDEALETPENQDAPPPTESPNSPENPSLQEGTQP